MADTTKIQFYLDNEALEVVKRSAPSEKKRGDWVSKAIIEYSKIINLVPADDQCGTLEQIADRIGRIEKRLASLDGKLDSLLERNTA